MTPNRANPAKPWRMKMCRGDTVEKGQDRRGCRAESGKDEARSRSWAPLQHLGRGVLIYATQSHSGKGVSLGGIVNRLNFSRTNPFSKNRKCPVVVDNVVLVSGELLHGFPRRVPLYCGRVLYLRHPRFIISHRPRWRHSLAHLCPVISAYCMHRLVETDSDPSLAYELFLLAWRGVGLGPAIMT